MTTNGTIIMPMRNFVGENSPVVAKIGTHEQGREHSPGQIRSRVRGAVSIGAAELALSDHSSSIPRKDRRCRHGNVCGYYTALCGALTLDFSP